MNKRIGHHRIRSAAIRGKREGSAAGYSIGREYGYHIGRCESSNHLLLDNKIKMRALKVLYVSAGIAEPYPALDQAITQGLRELVTDVVVSSPADPVAALASEVRPDLVLVLNGVAFPSEQVQQLREKGFTTAVWFTDDPYYTDWTMSIAPHYDYVFTLEVNCVRLYRQLGCKHSYYLPFAADPQIFKPKRVDLSYHYDICFIGTAFWNRTALIDAMADYLVDKRLLISGWWWDRLKNYQKLSSKIRLGAWMSSEETASYYNGAKLVINLHRQHDDDTINFNSQKVEALSLNPRCFEIAGCGTLQLSDERAELPRHYKPGHEIVVFHSVKELIDQIDYYLEHEQERREMAYNAFVRTMTEHTYRCRLNQMMDLIF